MSTLEQLVEIAKTLGPEEQHELLKQAALLRQRGERKPRRNLKGALSHLEAHVSEEDIREMRREAWKNFPREIEL